MKVTRVSVLLANSCFSVILTNHVALQQCQCLQAAAASQEANSRGSNPPFHRCIPGISAGVTDGIQALTCMRAVLPPPPAPQPSALRNWDTPLSCSPEPF